MIGTELGSRWKKLETTKRAIIAGDVKRRSRGYDVTSLRVLCRVNKSSTMQ